MCKLPRTPCQLDKYSHDYTDLSRGKQLSNNSGLRSFKPFFDPATKSLQLEGRLKNSLKILIRRTKASTSTTRKTSYHRTYHILQPLSTLNEGVTLTLNWIIQRRKVARTIFHLCVNLSQAILLW